ncbi:uncharacterized protein LOC135834624 [Planococcus citri]|uniref:uncharacterized protein LOC135834624 n=1 Tax=Planococcus citri TaxID=170843 RepID=UPI0031FA09A8
MAEEERALYCGYPSRKPIAISLIIIIFLNAILLNNDGPKFLKDLMNKNEFMYTWYFTLVQPFLSYFAILIISNKSGSTQSSSRNITLSQKEALLSCITCAQILEIFGSTALLSNSTDVSRGNADTIWIAMLFCYFGLQTYSSILMIIFAFETALQQKLEDYNNSGNDQQFDLRDVVISSSPSDGSPPSYEVCLLESENVHKLRSQTPPPSYTAIFNFPADKN